MKKILSALLACMLLAPDAAPQQHMGPVATPQLNTDYFVGQVPGFYLTIQLAVTAACTSVGARVVIPAGTTTSDTPAAATGCSKVAIIDRRVSPEAAYTWTGTGPYTLQGASVSVPGSNRQVLFNNSGALGADASYTYNNTTKQLLAGGVNGKVNSDQFNTSNNGAATVFANGTVCPSALCDVTYQPNSTSTEATPLPPVGSRIEDNRGNTVFEYEHNPAPYTPRSQPWATYGGHQHGVVYDGVSPTSYVTTSSYDRTIYNMRSWNYGNNGGWGGFAGDRQENFWYDRGITQRRSSFTYKYATGDLGYDYHYIWSTMGWADQSGEGVTFDTREGGQFSNYPVGTISSTTGTGDIAPVLSVGGAPVQDGAFLLDITRLALTSNFTAGCAQIGTTGVYSCPVAATLTATPATGALACGLSTANLTSFSITSNTVTFTAPNSFIAGDQVTVSGLTVGTYLNNGTFTVSATGLSSTSFQVAFTHANVGSTSDTGLVSLINQAPTVLRTATCNIALTAGGAYSTGIAVMANKWFPEKITITAAGTPSGGNQSITFTYLHPTPAGSTLWQGGTGNGDYLSIDQNLTINGFRTTWYVFGAVDSSHLAVGSNRAGGLGAPFPEMLALTNPPTLALQNIVSNGSGTITAQALTANPNAGFNLLASAVVSGCANSAFNGTATSLLNVGDLNHYTWSQSVSAGSTTGCSLSLPAASFGFHVYPGAEIRYSNLGVVGALEPNAVAWTNGDSIENPFFPTVAGNFNQRAITVNTTDANVRANLSYLYGAGWSNGYVDEIRNENSASTYIGGGGQDLQADVWFFRSGPHNGFFNLTSPPIGSGPLFNVGCQEVGCQDLRTWTVFQFQGGKLTYTPSNSNQGVFNYQNLFAQNLYGSLVSSQTNFVYADESGTLAQYMVSGTGAGYFTGSSKWNGSTFLPSHWTAADYTAQANGCYGFFAGNPSTSNGFSNFQDTCLTRDSPTTLAVRQGPAGIGGAGPLLNFNALNYLINGTQIASANLSDGSSLCNSSGANCPAISFGTPCIDATSTPNCSTFLSGFVALPISATSLTILDTKIQANTRIQLQYDESLGTALGVSCSATALGLVPTSRVPGTSFTVTANTTTTGFGCFHFLLFN